MSNKDLDNLFKSKLEDFGKSPANNLWDKIDEQVEKPKSNKRWVYSIVASILLLITISVVVKNWESTTSEQLAVLEEPLEVKNEIATSSDSSKVITDTDSANRIEPDKILKQPIKENSLTNKIGKANPQPLIALNVPDTAKANNEVESPTQIAIEMQEIENIAQNNTTDATKELPKASDNKTDEKRKALIFDISQFEDQKTSVAVNEEEKKDSKLKRIFKIARDIKEGESGLGDIREAKNDLFALNLKKDK